VCQESLNDKGIKTFNNNRQNLKKNFPSAFWVIEKNIYL